MGTLILGNCRVQKIKLTCEIIDLWRATFPKRSINTETKFLVEALIVGNCRVQKIKLTCEITIEFCLWRGPSLEGVSIWKRNSWGEYPMVQA